jgi:hypothetical protein
MSWKRFLGIISGSLLLAPLMDGRPIPSRHVLVQ